MREISPDKNKLSKQTKNYIDNTYKECGKHKECRESCEIATNSILNKDLYSYRLNKQDKCSACFRLEQCTIGECKYIKTFLNVDMRIEEDTQPKENKKEKEKIQKKEKENVNNYQTFVGYLE